MPKLATTANFTSVKNRDEKLVYSTDKGAHCPECEKALAACICRELKGKNIIGNGSVRVRRETGGRAGKTVTAIHGVALPQARLKDLLRELQKRCGTGGTIKDGIIEIQGDHLQLIIDELKKRGFEAKKSGG